VAAVGAEAVLLIKPQFEVGPKAAKGGVVKDPKLRQEAIDDVCAAAAALGADVLGTVASSLPGAKKGNVEELLHLRL
jgi:23S rRNA (cytidine1920-2'-O)/16S rRNA (cytidine1409-2'-O)-methyltransferase